MLVAVTAHNGPPMVPARDPVTIKLYGNRLYRPALGSYAALDDLIALARRGADVTALILSSSPTEH
jgi:polyhydroxyalkanoate synthesis regulator protein